MVAPKGNKFWLGRHHTKESKIKISLAKKGKKLGPRGPNKTPFSMETRTKMSLSKLGNKNSFYGKHHSLETKNKISSVLTGKSSLLKGLPLLEKTKIKMKQNHADVSGNNNPAWKGGRSRKARGYIYIYIPHHPYSIRGQVAEHRLVMEKKIG